MLQEQLAARGLHWRHSRNAQTQAGQAAAQIIKALAEAIELCGQASLALSGGRGPLLLMQHLEQAALEWEKVSITQVDERWVPADDPQSNAGLIWRCMPGVLRRARWLPLYRGKGLHADAQQAASQLAALLPLDVVVLGMGEDGHTASLFPQLPELADWLNPQGSELCVAVPAQGERLARLSMTARAIRTARKQLLLISGEQKYQALVAAVALDDPYVMPISAFLKPPLDIYYSP